MQLNELHPEERILVLGWMRESIENGIKPLVHVKAYKLFCVALRENQSFDPDVVWDILQPHQKEHFRRSAAALDLLDELIEAAEIEADGGDQDDGAELEAEPADVEGGPDDSES